MKGKELRIISLLVLDFVFFLLEVIVGYAVHSLALVADSFHMLNDIVSLFIALWAVKVKKSKPADDKYTYGWQRAEILGALVNAVFLIALCFTIVIEAIQRLVSPPEISNPVLVLVVGTAGLLSNFAGLVLFHEHGHSHSHGGAAQDEESGHSHVGESSFSVTEEEAGHSHEHGHSHASETSAQALQKASKLYDTNSSETDFSQYMPENVVSRYDEQTPLMSDKKHQKKRKSMNMEGVFLHVLGDAMGNVGVIFSALIIWKTSYSWRFYADPIISLVITVIIFSSALPLCKKSSKILLQATPPHVDSNSILSEINKLDDVKSIHDFHVWNLNEDILIASLHIQLNEAEGESFNKQNFLAAVKRVREVLHSYGIHSATIQPEFHGSAEYNSLNRKKSAYGETSKLNCAVDDATGCYNGQCLQ